MIAIVQSKDYDLSKLATKDQINLIIQDIAKLDSRISATELTFLK